MRLKEAILYNTRGTDLSQLTRHLPALMKDFYINNVVSKLGTLHPTVMQFNVTHRCNARCAICNIWKTRVSGEPDLDRWEDVFSDKIFETIEYLLISGGEPTLRGDLFEIVRSLTGRVPSLRKILIAINGIEKESLRVITIHYRTMQWEKYPGYGYSFT